MHHLLSHLTLSLMRKRKKKSVKERKKRKEGRKRSSSLLPPLSLISIYIYDGSISFCSLACHALHATHCHTSYTRCLITLAPSFTAHLPHLNISGAGEGEDEGGGKISGRKRMTVTGEDRLFLPPLLLHARTRTLRAASVVRWMMISFCTARIFARTHLLQTFIKKEKRALCVISSSQSDYLKSCICVNLSPLAHAHAPISLYLYLVYNNIIKNILS